MRAAGHFQFLLSGFDYGTSLISSLIVLVDYKGADSLYNLKEALGSWHYGAPSRDSGETAQI